MLDSSAGLLAGGINTAVRCEPALGVEDRSGGAKVADICARVSSTSFEFQKEEGKYHDLPLEHLSESLSSPESLLRPNSPQ